MSDLNNTRPRPMVITWVRRFGAPLREIYNYETEISEQFLDLLEEADRRTSGDGDSRDQ